MCPGRARSCGPAIRMAADVRLVAPHATAAIDARGPTVIGYGMATAFYPAERAPASVEAILYANGTAVMVAPRRANGAWYLYGDDTARSR